MTATRSPSAERLALVMGHVQRRRADLLLDAPDLVAQPQTDDDIER